MSGKPPMPARGAVAGIKADLARAKESGKYDPRGVGNAFTHNFLNQKPWHPMNFRNQITKYEAEQKQIQEQKAKEAGQAEFEAEQESMRTLSYLSEAEQQRYRDRQSISFMYTKPPGLEAALAKEAAAVKPPEGAVAAAPGATAGPSGGSGGKGGRQPLTPEQLQQQEIAAAHAKELDRLREDPFAVMLTARMNLKNNDRFIIKHGGAGDAPAHGGYRKDAQNQRLLDAPPDQGPQHTQQEVAPGVVADAEDLAVLESMPEHERSAVLRRLRKMQRQAEKEQQLEQAHAVLRSAGYDLSALQQQAESMKHGKKAKHKSKQKSKKKRRRKDDAGRQHRSSGSSSSDG